MILRSRRVVLPDGVRPASVSLRSGKIETVGGWEAAGAEDLGDRVLLPGLVDVHVHLNEPGRESWEGFETATRAAAAGGATALVDMPLNSLPPTTTLSALEAKRRRALGKCSVDYAFWGGVIPGNEGELLKMAEAGALGFKCFLIDSGVEEFPPVREDDLRKAMPILAELGLPLLVHAELPGPAPAPGPSRRYRDFLATRPPEWETAAIRLMIRLSLETGCRVHIVHLSAAEALPELALARREGVPVTAETCPHYLSMAAETIPDGATHFKCCPPIRGQDNAERLWAGLKEGVIDFIASDHSPCSPDLKRLDSGDFSAAWGGIAGLQFRLPVTWTQMRRRGMDLADLARLTASEPARFAGLPSKGRIAPGADADLLVFEPEAEFRLVPDMVRHRHALTPYSGMSLRGTVESVFLRGERIFSRGSFIGKPGGRETAAARPGRTT